METNIYLNVQNYDSKKIYKYAKKKNYLKISKINWYIKYGGPNANLSELSSRVQSKGEVAPIRFQQQN